MSEEGAPEPAAASRWSAWRRDMGEALRELWVPLIPGALIMAGATLLWQYAAGFQDLTLNLLVGTESGWVGQELERALDARAAAAELLAARAAGTAGWREDADAMLREDAGFRAVLELDTALALRDVVPSAARVAAAANPRDDEVRAVALRIASGTLQGHAALVTTAPLSSGRSELLACAPVVRDGRRVGWIVGIARPRDLLNAALGRTLRRGYSVAIYEGSTLLYGAREYEDGPGTDYIRETVVPRGPLLWRVKVWPADELARGLMTPIPAAVLALGALLAFLVSLVVYLWRVAGRTAEAVSPSGRAEDPRERAVPE